MEENFVDKEFLDKDSLSDDSRLSLNFIEEICGMTYHLLLPSRSKLVG